jgi:hypothetical protein
MSDIRIDDLSPTPFFARFLEGQFAKPLTDEEMKGLRGGFGPNAGPADEPRPICEGTGAPPSMEELLRNAFKGFPFDPVAPSPVTMAYPSDQANVPV